MSCSIMKVMLKDDTWKKGFYVAEHTHAYKKYMYLSTARLNKYLFLRGDHLLILAKKLAVAADTQSMSEHI